MLSLYLLLLESVEEQKTFQEIYYSYRSLLYQVANQILKDTWLAEDAVQNAFLSLAKNIKKISGWNCIQIRNYLIIIVRNAALQIYNKNQNEISVEEIPETNTDLHKIEIDIENKDAQKILFTYIKSLDAKYGDVLILKYYYGLRNKEIAKCLKISLENVKIRLVRGKSMIKKLLLKGESIDGKTI